MHPLDNPVWTALTTLQAPFALSSELAMRFRPEMTLLGALQEATREAYASLQHLVLEHRTHDQPVTLYFAAPPRHPEGWKVVRQVELLQMVHSGELTRNYGPPGSAAVVDLSESDVPAMSEIYAATRPGRTLCPRIQQLGTFVGARDAGKLLAIGGLRLHLPGYREITTVGTLPGHRGHGYATAIVAALVQRIRDDGELPFLTVGAANARAIEIYRRLGFQARARLYSETIR